MNKSIIWNPIQKFVFRFTFILFPSFIFFYSNILEFDLLYQLQKYPYQVLQPIINLFGQLTQLIPKETTIEWAGGGDTLSDYLLVLSLVVVALFGATIWTFLDFKRNNYCRLYYWLGVIIRYYLALILMQYGMAKIIKTQFPFPGLDTLTKNYGDSSPMNLAWTFFGFSKGYNLVLGIVELLALFLLFRRTVTFGAFISLCVTLNIMAINFFYDVPVKILSTALVVLSFSLLLPNLKRLYLFFILNRPSKLVVFKPGLDNKRLNRVILCAKIILIGFVFSITLSENIKLVRIIGDTAIKTPLYGIYEVDVFVLNNDTLPPLLTDRIRWKQLVVNWRGNARIKMMNGEAYYHDFKVDTNKKQISLMYDGHNLLTYYLPDKDHLTILGKLNEDSVAISFIKTNPSHMNLLNRGFRWVSDVPFNQ